MLCLFDNVGTHISVCVCVCSCSGGVTVCFPFFSVFVCLKCVLLWVLCFVYLCVVFMYSIWETAQFTATAHLCNTNCWLQYQCRCENHCRGIEKPCGLFMNKPPGKPVCQVSALTSKKSIHTGVRWAVKSSTTKSLHATASNPGLMAIKDNQILSWRSN